MMGEELKNLCSDFDKTIEDINRFFNPPPHYEMPNSNSMFVFHAENLKKDLIQAYIPLVRRSDLLESQQMRINSSYDLHYQWLDKLLDFTDDVLQTQFSAPENTSHGNMLERQWNDKLGKLHALHMQFDSGLVLGKTPDDQIFLDISNTVKSLRKTTRDMLENYGLEHVLRDNAIFKMAKLMANSENILKQRPAYQQVNQALPTERVTQTADIYEIKSGQRLEGNWSGNGQKSDRDNIRPSLTGVMSDEDNNPEPKDP